MAYLQIVHGQMKLNGCINSDDKFEWKKGPANQSPLPMSVMHLLDRVILPYYFSIFEQEENKEVIERVLENMRELTEDFGPAVYANQMDKIVKYIILFLQKKAFCQDGMAIEDGEDKEEFQDENPEEDYGDEDEEGDDGIDHDEVIFGNVSDLVIAIARSMGNEFAPYFTQLASHLVEYTTEKHPKSDKNMALGCLSEVFAACEGVIPTYFNDYLPLLEANSNTKDSKVNRNVAYSIGVLAQHAPLLFRPHVPNALKLLERLHSESSQIDAQDNIVAALCRIIEF